MKKKRTPLPDEVHVENKEIIAIQDGKIIQSK